MYCHLCLIPRRLRDVLKKTKGSIRNFVILMRVIMNSQRISDYVQVEMTLAFRRKKLSGYISNGANIS